MRKAGRQTETCFFGTDGFTSLFPNALKAGGPQHGAAEVGQELGKVQTFKNCTAQFKAP
jgi:hypothetical protein